MAIQPGWGEQWETLASAINGYYGGGVQSAQYQQVVNMLNSGSYTMEEMESILANIPEFTRTYNSAGQLTGVSYNVSTSTASTAGSVAQEINSNVANSAQTQFSNVQTITKDPQTGKVTIGDNLVKYKTGQLAPTTMKGVAISTLQGVMAASAGITIGKTINQLAYDSGFNWLSWAGVSMESLNPESWANITRDDDSIGAKLFNMILGIDDTSNNPQAYMPEEAFAYMVAYMNASGVFGKEGYIEDDPGVLYHPECYNFPIVTSEMIVTDSGNGVEYPGSGVKLAVWAKENSQTAGWALYCSKTPGHYYWKYLDYTPNEYDVNYRITTKAGHEAYVANITQSLGPPFSGYNLNTLKNSQDISFSDLEADLAEIILYGTQSEQSVPGITDQSGARQFDNTVITNPTDISETLQALKNQFPELWENRVEVSPDGTNTVIYIPVGFPTGGLNQNPTTNGASQLDTEPDIAGQGANATDELVKTLIDAITHAWESEGMEGDTNTPTKPVDPNGDPRGTGENPPIVPPVGSASALWKIYNPSQSQLDTFGAWLWSSNFVDQLLKLFNDPMQAIIGLHKVYCNPPISGSGPIKVGYLVSDASANYVSNQYTEIDCGEIDMKEHFGNVFDYDGFTRVSVFLPFIGFRDLDTKDVMRGKINIKYGVDVLTGACLAKIKITRDLNSPILYTFEGNCAVQYPVSSGSYIGIVTGALGIAGSIAGTIATGGAMAPAILRAGAAIPNMHANIQHSGNISSNVGALGPKKPYVVIQRPQTQMPQNGILIEGEGQNESVLLGSLAGFVRVKKGDYNGIPGTSTELNELRELLENGIYMS